MLRNGPNVGTGLRGSFIGTVQVLPIACTAVPYFVDSCYVVLRTSHIIPAWLLHRSSTTVTSSLDRSHLVSGRLAYFLHTSCTVPAKLLHTSHPKRSVCRPPVMQNTIRVLNSRSNLPELSLVRQEAMRTNGNCRGPYASSKDMGSCKALWAKCLFDTCFLERCTWFLHSSSILPAQLLQDSCTALTP